MGGTTAFSSEPAAAFREGPEYAATRRFICRKELQPLAASRFQRIATLCPVKHRDRLQSVAKTPRVELGRWTGNGTLQKRKPP